MGRGDFLPPLLLLERLLFAGVQVVFTVQWSLFVGRAVAPCGVGKVGVELVVTVGRMVLVGTDPVNAG